MRKMSRRTFLVETAQAAGLVALSALGARELQAAEKAPAAPSPSGPVTLGKSDSYPLGKFSIVTDAKDADGKPVQVQLAVLRRQDKTAVMSARCTHAGCTVKVRDDDTLRCPCHWAKFDANGKPIWGLAKDPLQWFDTKVLESGELRVDLSKPVDPPPKS